MYHAFISYSHAADDRLAPELQSALHRFAKPWYRLRALRIFRDKTSLSATPGLWPMIQEALDASEYFILLASPEAAASVWVGREIQHWLTTKGSDRLLIVLTDGELVWEGARPDFDRDASSALPMPLAGAFRQEPLWIDLRWAHDREDLSIRDARFRDAVAELAATLHGRPKDVIAGEDVRQHRRTRRVAWSAVMSLFILALGLAVAAWIAVGQRNRAEERGAVALSRQLAAQAVSLAGGERGDLALLLSLEALRVWPTVDARNGLLTALTRDASRRFHLHGHMGEVPSLAFSDDGSELLSLGCEGIDVLGLCDHFGVRRWDTRSGQPRGQAMLPGANRWTVLSAKPGSNGLVARDGQGYEWDPVTGEALGRPPQPGVWSLRGDLVVESTNPGLVLRRVETGRRFGPVLSHPAGQIRTVVFHPSAPLMATGGSDGTVRLWHTDELLRGVFEPYRILKAHTEAVIDLDFSPDGAHLISAGSDDSVLVWDLASEAPPRHLLEREGIASVVFSPDGRRLVVAFSIGEEGGALQLWDPVAWRPLATLSGKAPLAISPDGRLLAATGAAGSVMLRDLDRQRPLGRSLEKAGDPQSLVFVGDRLLVAGGRDESLRIWDLDSTSLKHDPIPTAQGAVQALAAHPDGRRLASAGTDGRILLWDLEENPSEPLQAFAGHEAPVAALDFSADGTRLVSGGFDDALRLWDVESGEPVEAAFDTGHDVYAVAFDRAASRVVAATEDGSVLLWALADGGASGRVVGTHLLQSDGMTGIAFGPEDRFLVSSSLEQTQFWGLVPGEPAVRPPLAGSFAVLHPSGAMAALVTDSGAIQLVDVTAWQPFDTPLGAHDASVFAMAFSPDGRRLATAAEDDLVLWDVDLDSWRTRACVIARRNLTPDEWERYLGNRPYETSCPDAPEPPAMPLDAARALGLAVRAAKLGKAATARQLFAEAARLGAASDDAELANQICWFGALRGAFVEVFDACERAVDLEPENGGYRDSRGLVRALAGDVAGAIEDFRAYVAWAEGNRSLADRGARRQAWIQALEAGRNPFDPLELHRVRSEGAF